MGFAAWSGQQSGNQSLPSLADNKKLDAAHTCEGILPRAWNV